MANCLLKDVEKILLDSDYSYKINKELIIACKKAQNLELLGAISTIMTDDKFYKRIEPPLVFNDYYPFLFDYYIRCMQINCDKLEDFLNTWSDCGYLASYDLSNFIKGIWDDNQISEQEKINMHMDIKKKLESLSQNNTDFRDILNHLVQSLFENKQIKQYFIGSHIEGYDDNDNPKF